MIDVHPVPLHRQRDIDRPSHVYTRNPKDHHEPYRHRYVHDHIGMNNAHSESAHLTLGNIQALETKVDYHVHVMS
jgi:hypothetical protein